jgi:predicted lipoprotein with Yx(FWY)xxD motif
MSTRTTTPTERVETSDKSRDRASGTRRAGLALGAAALIALAAACGGGGSGNSASGSGGGGAVAVERGATGGGVSTVSTGLGTILTDSGGMTLYAFAADARGASNCDAQCLQYWPPVSPGSAFTPPTGVDARLGQITGTNGSPQLTVDGWPVYTYAGDHGVGDTTGQGLDTSGGLWWAIGTDGQWIKSGDNSSSSSSSSTGSGGGSTSGYSRGGY